MTCLGEPCCALLGTLRHLPCERAAVLGAGGGELLLPKQAGGGVTAALAVEKEITLSFSDQD